MSSSEERFVGALLQPLWDLGLTVGQHVREISELRRARSRQPRVPARAARRAVHRRRRAALSAARGVGARTLPSTIGGRCSMRCCSSSTHAPRAVQRHGLPARAGHQERARRPARHRRDAAHPAAEAGRHRRRARSRRASAAGRRGFLPARPLDPAPRERPRRERPDPRAAGESRRDVRLRGPAVAAARRDPDGRVLPPRAGVVAGAGAGAAGGHAAGRR